MELVWPEDAKEIVIRHTPVSERNLLMLGQFKWGIITKFNYYF
jgi:hypothetical protein